MNRRLVLLLLAALCLCFTTVSAYNVVDEIVEFVLEKRQDNSNDTATVTTTISSEPAPPETTTTTTSTTEISTSDEPITTPPTSTPSSRSTSTIPESTSTTEEPPATTTETSSSETPTEGGTTTRITTKTREVATVTLTISGTLSLSTVYTSETQMTVETPTGLSEGSKDDGSNGGGISTSTRNTIIGVVVGVGGAIIIGALLIVGFRLRRKKSGAGYDDDLRASPSSTNPMRQQDAFKATLDQYHKPPGTVNPSANF